MPKVRLHINDKVICVALLLLSLAPVVLAVGTTVRHWLPLPLWDEWFTPGEMLRSYAWGTLSFNDFFLQHNESRKVFPRLLYLALAKLHGWDVRDGMIVTLLEVAGLCGLLLVLLLRTAGANALSTCAAFTISTYLSFSPSQYDNFLSGIQFEPFVPGVAVVLVVLVDLSGLQFGAKTVLNLIVALVATYTYANGMLLWILGIPLPAADERASKSTRIKWYSLFAAAGVAAIAGYFINYQRPSVHPRLRFNIVQIIHYIILWTGGYFQSPQLSPFVVGSIVLVLWIATATIAVLLIRDGGDWRQFYPWLALGAYALASSTVTAAGRLGFGVDQSLATRYAAFSLFLYLALVGNLFALYCYYRANSIQSGRRWVITAAVTGIVAAIPPYVFCFGAAQELVVRTAQRNSRLLCALEWIDAFPTNPDLKLIFPFQDVLQLRADALAKTGLFRCPLVSPRLLDRIKEADPGTDPSRGGLQAALREKSLFVNGWMWRPNVGPRPNCVLIGVREANEHFEPLFVTAPGAARLDVDRYYRQQTKHAIGFGGGTFISAPIRGSIEAWAVDTSTEMTWPLGRVVPTNSR